MKRGPFPLADRRPATVRVIGFWGWIGDRERTAAQLGMRESRPTSEQFVVAAIARWGIAGLDRLVGEYSADLITDSGERLLVRDHVGLVPLYYGFQENGELFCHPLIDNVQDRCSQGIDSETLIRHLSKTVPVDPQVGTFFEGVWRVPPGHVVVVDGGTRRTVRYSRPELTKTTRASFDEAGELLDRAINAAVKDALAGSSRVGIHVSGGLDSGVVAGVARKQLAVDQECVLATSWVPRVEPGDPEGDEQRALRVSAQALGFEITHADLSTLGGSWLAGADPLVFQPWHSIYESVLVPEYRRHHVDTVLSGWGGDQVASFPGVDPIWQFLRAGRFPSAYRAATARSSGRGDSLKPAKRMKPAKRIVGTILRRVNERSAFQPSMDVATRRWTATDPMVEKRWREIHSYYHAQLRTTRTYQLAAIHSDQISPRAEAWWRVGHEHHYEYRYPLADQRVIRAALTMQPDFFLDHAANRKIFRKVAGGYLPEEISQRDDKYEPIRVGDYESKRLPLTQYFERHYPEAIQIADTFDNATEALLRSISSSS